ncbi:MAG TPA: LysE family transporter [Clostridiaceae bacterium]
MLKYLIQGLFFGLAYVAPIGTQNLYVINTAASRSKLKTYETVFITIFFDISLAIACFFGIGYLIDKFSILKGIILLLGAIAVIYIGISLITSRSTVATQGKVEDSLIKVALTCFFVTWLNPQAIIDGSLLLGGFRTTLGSGSNYFLLGVCIASFLWFNTLATLVSIFKSKFNKIIKWINIICGLILIAYGIKLGYSFIVLFM